MSKLPSFFYCLWAILVPIHLWANGLGAIGTISQIAEGHTAEYKAVLEKASKNPILLNELDTAKEIKLSPYFIRSLQFHSESRFLKLAKDDQCTFLALLENGLLKINTGEIKTILINYKNKKGEVETSLVKKSDYLNYVYKKKCSNNKEISLLFKNSNLKKTITSINFQIPKTEQECLTTLSEWQQNIYTPYLCKIPFQIKKGKMSQQKLLSIPLKQSLKRKVFLAQAKRANHLTLLIPSSQRSYLNNLCHSIVNKDQFCEPYLAKDVWSKIINGEFSKSKMKYRCKNILNLKKDPSSDQLKICAIRFKNDFNTCETEGAEGFSSLFPMNNCREISKALNVGHLKANYHDCPGMIDNAGIINIHRIVNHFMPREYISSSNNCSSEPNYSFAKLYLDFKKEELWPLKICYQDKIKSKYLCRPYVPNLNTNSKLSESKVIESILRRTENLPQKTTCLITPKNRYNPSLLKYKVGCHIVFDNKICSSLYCPKKIFLNKKEITHLRFEGKPVFDYFPNSFANEKFALSSIIRELLNIDQREIRNLTELKTFLKSSKKSIIHGVGCIEDLFPKRFQARAFNQCSPLPFIIDGYYKEFGNIMISIRTAIDDVHSPYPITWNYLLNSIIGYQELHPLKLWPLYGLK